MGSIWYYAGLSIFRFFCFVIERFCFYFGFYVFCEGAKPTNHHPFEDSSLVRYPMNEMKPICQNGATPGDTCIDRQTGSFIRNVLVLLRALRCWPLFMQFEFSALSCVVGLSQMRTRKTVAMQDRHANMLQKGDWIWYYVANSERSGLLVLCRFALSLSSFFCISCACRSSFRVVPRMGSRDRLRVCGVRAMGQNSKVYACLFQDEMWWMDAYFENYAFSRFESEWCFFANEM